MRQVVMNLLINASEALGERGGTITVKTGTIDCDRGDLAETILDENLPAGRYVFLEVSDNGCGMSDTFVREALFRPFNTTKQKGLGIGLFQCRRVVQAHGGGMHVMSEVGRGTTFLINLPAVSEKL